MELGIIKNDVLVDLRTKRYYNEQEITRLVQSEDISHEARVEQLVFLTKENVVLMEAAKLIEIYFPAQKQAPAAPASPSENTTDQPTA